MRVPAPVHVAWRDQDAVHGRLEDPFAHVGGGAARKIFRVPELTVGEVFVTDQQGMANGAADSGENAVQGPVCAGVTAQSSSKLSSNTPVMFARRST
ncbi:hypothetical protein [Glutamicibacter arilaitensis]|uniref:hypothetical protein n=1 Tax=Glutamicibacter arilaitensis TaxID=256701 RepID=UPI00384E4786